jgi:hypothetical protein
MCLPAECRERPQAIPSRRARRRPPAPRRKAASHMPHSGCRPRGLSDDDQPVPPARDLELPPLDPDERLERRTGRGATARAVTVRCVQESILDPVTNRAALTTADEHPCAGTAFGRHLREQLGVPSAGARVRRQSGAGEIIGGHKSARDSATRRGPFGPGRAHRDSCARTRQASCTRSRGFNLRAGRATRAASTRSCSARPPGPLTRTRSPSLLPDQLRRGGRARARGAGLPAEAREDRAVRATGRG